MEYFRPILSRKNANCPSRLPCAADEKRRIPPIPPTCGFLSHGQKLSRTLWACSATAGAGSTMATPEGSIARNAPARNG